MRKHKFRGKRIDNGRWAYGYYFIEERDVEDGIIWRNIPQIQQRCGDYFQYFDVDPTTVEQFTGVKERYPQMVGEGQEIYFGDVVRLFGGEYHKYDQTIVVKSAYDIVAMEESENVQLLGNIWDNPELLKEGIKDE